MATLHVADQTDYLAADAEWRKEYAELMITMSKRLRLLLHEFRGAGDGKTFEAVYQGTIQLRADLDVLKERQTSVLEKLKENRDAWEEAVSTRNGDLAKLDTLFEERKRSISANQETIGELENRQQELQSSVTSLQEDLSRARTSLITTQHHEVALRQSFEDDAVRSLSEREQKLQGDISEWELQVQKASDEHKEHENQLQDTQKHQEERQLALVESEEILKTRQSNIDEESNKLKCARSILQTLANDVGSTADTTCTRVDLDVLAASINKLFLNMQHDCAGKDKALADLNKHHSETEAKLEIATQNSTKLATSLDNRTKQFKVSEEKALCIPKKDLQIQQLKTELSEKSEEFKKQAKEIASYKEYCMSKKSDLETELQALKTECSTSQAETEEFRSQLEEVKNIRDNQAEQLSGLLTNTIPGLKAWERLSKKTVEDLTADVARHRQHANSNAAEVTDMRVSNNWLKEASKKAKQDCADRDDRITALIEDNSKLRKEIFTTLQKTDRVDHDNATQRLRMNELKEDLRTKEEKIQQLEASVSAACTEIQSAKDESTAKDGKIADLGRELGESQSKAVIACGKLTDELTEKDGQIRDLTHRLSELQRTTITETERLGDELSAKDGRITDLDDELNELRRTKTAEIGQLEIQLNDKNGQVKVLNDNFDGLQRANAAEIGRLTLELTGKDGEINALHAKLKDLQGTKAAEIEHLKADLTGKDCEINTLNARLEDLQRMNAAEIDQLKTEVTGKDGEIDALNARLEDLQELNAAEIDQLKTEVTGKDGEIDTLNARLEDLQEMNAAEIQQLKTELNDKNGQVSELNRKKEEEIGKLQQDLNTSRKSSSQKDSELESLRRELGELRTLITSIAPKDKEIKDLRQQVQVLQDTATSKDSDLDQVNQDLNDLNQTTSAEIRDLRSKATHNANEANQVQQALDSERVAVTELSQEVKEQKRDLSQMERILRDHVAVIAAREAELTQIKKIMEDRERSTDSGMDQLESERDRAEGKADRMKETLRKREGQLLKVRDEWATVREENQRLKKDIVSRFQTATELQTLTRLQPRRPRVPSADQEDEILDASVSPQQDRRGITRVHGPADAPQRSGRKRKSSEMDPSDEEEGPTESSQQSGGQHTVAATPEASPQQTPANAISVTWSIDNIRNPDYVPSPSIPAAILTDLRVKMGDWDKVPRQWTKPPAGHRCVEAMVKKKKAEWSNGEGFRCNHCTRYNELCVVVGEGAMMTLLPAYQEQGKPPVASNQVGYWKE